MNSGGDQHILDTRDKVQNWLQEEGWSIEPLSLPATSWAIKAISPAKQVLSVLQMSNQPDQIGINALIEFNEGQRQQLNRLARPERLALVWELYLRLVQMEVFFDGVVDPLRRVIVGQRIYYDGLTKDTFMKRTARTVAALLIVLGMVGRKLEEVPPARPNGPLLH